MEAGRELDALIAEKVMQEPPRISWELLSPDGHASAFTAETKKEVEDWQAYYNQRYPNSWMADYHVGTWKHYPRYSTDIAAAWQVVEKLAELGMLTSVCWGRSGNHGIIASVDILEAGFDKPIAAHTVPMAICIAALKALNISTD